MRIADELEAENIRLRAALEAVEWLWIGQQDQNHPTDLICPWCKEKKPGHASDCARQAALSPEQPAAAESEKV